MLHHKSMLPVMRGCARPNTQTHPGWALKAVHTRLSGHPSGYLMVNGHTLMKGPRTTVSNSSNVSYTRPEVSYTIPELAHTRPNVSIGNQCYQYLLSLIN
jgi:hypothetical protein